MSNTSSNHSSRLERGVSEVGIPLENLSTANGSVSQDEIVFVKVIDAKYNGTPPEVRGTFSSSDKIHERMESIPPHEPKTARILDVTIHSNLKITGLRQPQGPEETREAREGLMGYLHKNYTRRFDSRRTFRWLNDPLLVNDIGSISAQWSQDLAGNDGHFYRLVSRTSLQQDPLDFDLRPRDSYLTCAQDADERLIGKCIGAKYDCSLY